MTLQRFYFFFLCMSFKGQKKYYLRQISFIFGAQRTSPSTLLSGYEEESAPGRGVFLDFWRLSIAFLGLSGGIVLTIMVYLTHFTLVPSFLFYVYWHLNKTLVFHMSSFRLGIAPLCKRNRWNQSSYTNAKQH